MQQTTLAKINFLPRCYNKVLQDIKKIKQFYAYIQYRANGLPFNVGKGHSNRYKDFTRRNAYFTSIVEKDGRQNITFEIFNTTNEDQAFRLEEDFIEVLTKCGYKLVNMTTGGEGSSGHVKSPESIEKWRKKVKGQKRPPEFGAKISKSLTGVPRSLERRKIESEAGKKKIFSTERRRKIGLSHKGKSSGMKGKSAWNRGKETPNEVRQKISKSKLGKKRSQEAIEKTRFKTTGQKRTPDQRERIAAAHRGKPHTPERCENISKSLIGKTLGRRHASETIEKMRKAHTGHKHSPETRKKQSIARKELPLRTRMMCSSGSS